MNSFQISTLSSESLQLGGEHHPLQWDLQACEAFDGVTRRGNQIEAKGDG